MLAEVFVGGSTSDFQAALLGRKLVGVGRKGKYFYLELDGNGPSVVMHFGERSASVGYME